MGLAVYFVNAGFPGVGAIGRHGEKEGFWKQVYVDERIPQDGDVYVFGAFSPVYRNVAASLPSDAAKGFLFSSSVGEVDLEPIEREYLRFIIQWRDIEFVWFGDLSMGELFNKGFYAPYPVSLEVLEEASRGVEPRELRGNPAVTLLNPSTAKKNALNQIMAVKFLEKKGFSPVLHTVMEQYVPLLKLFGVDYERHDWLEGEDYWSVLKGSDLNLCVSWAETFSYQSLEAVYAGTPILGSSTVDWLPDRFKCYVPNNPVQVAERMQDILEEEERLGHSFLETLAEKRNIEARDVFDKNVLSKRV